jgi:hypothetical protein
MPSTVWREPSNHATDRYFCMVPPVSGGIMKKKKWTLMYPNIPSALSPFSSTRWRNFRSRTSERIYHSFRRQRQVDLGFSWATSNQWNDTSPTVGLLCHSHIFSQRTIWIILFAIWSCPRAKQSYWDQNLNNGIFSRKCLNFFILMSSSAAGAFFRK